MARRGENIRKRKDGRWEGRYYALNAQTGNHVLRSVYARTYKEVKEKLYAARQCAETTGSGQASGSTICFNRAAEEWLAVVEKEKKYATYTKYRIVYEAHIKSKLGACSFEEISSETIAEVFRSDGPKPFSNSLQKSIACVLNQIIAYGASRHEMRPPAYSCPAPRRREMAGRVEILNQYEQASLFRCLYDEMDIYKFGIVLCISTGLRLGEICSLKWADIDFKGKMLRINSTVQRIAVEGREKRTALLEGEPKSIFSKREIPLSDEIIKLLSRYHGSAGERGYVINSDRPMEPRTYQNKFQNYLRAAGVKKKNFHALRHTFATNCVSSGVDIKSLSEILGHSDVKITLNLYVHPTLETKRQHMNSISAIYGQFVGQEQGRFQ